MNVIIYTAVLSILLLYIHENEFYLSTIEKKRKHAD